MQRISINVTKIPRDRIKPGKNGQYVDLVLFDNRDGKDQYGNDGFVAIDVSKEERENGVKGPIVGNWKHIGGASSKPAAEPARKPTPPPPAKRPPVDPDLDAPEDDIPF